jgi:hypothetical protein
MQAEGAKIQSIDAGSITVTAVLEGDGGGGDPWPFPSVSAVRVDRRVADLSARHLRVPVRG